MTKMNKNYCQSFDAHHPWSPLYEELCWKGVLWLHKFCEPPSNVGEDKELDYLLIIISRTTSLQSMHSSKVQSLLHTWSPFIHIKSIFMMITIILYPDSPISTLLNAFHSWYFPKQCQGEQTNYHTNKLSHSRENKDFQIGASSVTRLIAPMKI